MSRPRVFAIDGVVPVVDPSAFVHSSAVLIGDVVVGPGCYVGPCASLRGDFGRIVLSAGANVQDSCVMHSFPEGESIVEESGHIGHGAVLHGCRIGKNVLIGMNSVVMDNAEIGDGSIVAACSFVPAGMVVPPRSMLVGVPARVLRMVSDEEIEWKIRGTRVYQVLAQRCRQSMQECDALTSLDPGRRSIKAALTELGAREVEDALQRGLHGLPV